MKRLAILFVLFSYWAYSSDYKLIEEVNNSEEVKNGLLTFFPSYLEVGEDFPNIDFDTKKALVLFIPGFNIKPKSSEFAVKLFASNGIPSFLLNFDGTKPGDSNIQMTFDNWLLNTQNGIDKAIALSRTFNRKLIIAGHSLGGLYAQYELGLRYQNNTLPDDVEIGLVLLAPADGLRPLKQIFQLNHIQMLSESNEQMVSFIKTSATLLKLFGLDLEKRNLGKLICGEHAAQDNLTINSLEALIKPSIGLKYPYSIKALRIFHSDDGLMNEFYYSNIDYGTNKNLGEFGDPILSHTFEYLKREEEKKNSLMDEIFTHFDLNQ